MAKFVLAFHGTGNMGDMSQMSEEDMKAGMAAWGAWYASMGSALVDGGNPFAAGTSIAPSGDVADGTNSGLTGYTIIDAPDMAGAQAIAKGCPVLENGVSVDIYHAMDMPG